MTEFVAKPPQLEAGGDTVVLRNANVYHGVQQRGSTNIFTRQRMATNGTTAYYAYAFAEYGHLRVFHSLTGSLGGLPVPGLDCRMQCRTIEF